MAFTLSETVITEIMRRINNDLAGFIATINAGVTDGFTIENPLKTYDYPPTIRLLTDFPAVGLVDGATTFEDDTSWSATGVHRFSVVAFVSDLDQRALSWKLRRYSEALANCILAGRTLPPDGWGVVLERIDPGPTLGRRGDPETRMSWVTLTFTVKTDQNT